MIAFMRIKCPSKCILIGKTDLGAAYCHVHANAQISATCIAVSVKLAFLFLSLPFGTTHPPAEYTTTSEAEIDLENDLLSDTSCDATNLQLPHQHLIPREDYLPASEPLFKSDQIVLNINEKEASMDRFIDDIITINIDKP